LVSNSAGEMLEGREVVDIEKRPAIVSVAVVQRLDLVASSRVETWSSISLTMSARVRTTQFHFASALKEASLPLQVLHLAMAGFHCWPLSLAVGPPWDLWRCCQIFEL